VCLACCLLLPDLFLFLPTPTPTPTPILSYTFLIVRLTMASDEDPDVLGILNAHLERGHAIPTQTRYLNITLGQLGYLDGGQFELIEPVTQYWPGGTPKPPVPPPTFGTAIVGKLTNTDISIETPSTSRTPKPCPARHVFEWKLVNNTIFPDLIRKNVHQWMTANSHHSRRSPVESPSSSSSSSSDQDLILVGGWIKGCSGCGPDSGSFRGWDPKTGLTFTMRVERSPSSSPPRSGPPSPRSGSPVISSYNVQSFRSAPNDAEETEHGVSDGQCLFLSYYKMRRVELTMASGSDLGSLSGSVVGSMVSLARTDTRSSLVSRISLKSRKSQSRPEPPPLPSPPNPPTPPPRLSSSPSRQGQLVPSSRGQTRSESDSSVSTFKGPWNPVDVILDYVLKHVQRDTKVAKALQKNEKRETPYEVFAVTVGSHFDEGKVMAKWRGGEKATNKNSEMLPIPKGGLRECLEKVFPALDVTIFEDDVRKRVHIYAELCVSSKKDCKIKDPARHHFEAGSRPPSRLLGIMTGRSS